MIDHVTARTRTRPPSLLHKMVTAGAVIVAVVALCLLTIGVGLWLVRVPPQTQNIVFVPNQKSGGVAPILLAEIDGKNGQVVVYQFPSELKVTVIGGYGEYQLGAVKKLLELEKKDSTFVRAAFGHVFGTGVDGVQTYAPHQPIAGKWQLLKALLQQRQTWVLAIQLKDFAANRIQFKPVVNREAWDQMMNQGLSQRLNDDCTVAIVNATDQNGLANQLSRVLEQSGVKVVRATNSIWDDPKTSLYYSPEQVEKCWEVTSRVQSISPIELPLVVDATKLTQYRAQIVLLVGEELAQVFIQN